MPNEPQNTRKASMWLAGKIGGGFSSVAILGFVGASVWNQFFELKDQVSSLQSRIAVQELATESVKLDLAEVKSKHDSEKKALWTDLARKNREISELKSEAKLLQFIVTRTAASEWFGETIDQSETLSLSGPEEGQQGQGQGGALMSPEFEPLLAVPVIEEVPVPVPVQVDVEEYRKDKMSQVPLSQQEIQERERIEHERSRINQQIQQQSQEQRR